MSKFCMLQGELQKIDLFQKQGNEAFACVHTCTETIRLYNTVPLFLEQHINHLCYSLKQFDIAIPYTLEYQKVLRSITRLLNVNKVYKGGICTISVRCYASVDASVFTTEPQVVLFIEPTEQLDFVFNIEGFRLGIFSKFSLPAGTVYSDYSAMNYVWIQAQLFKQNQQVDAVCVYNEHKQIVTTDFGDILYVYDDELYLVHNPYAKPIIAMFVLYLKKQGIHVNVQQQCAISDLERASEVFLCHHIYGIRWVSRFRNEVYGLKLAKKIHVLLLQCVHSISQTM